jgi:DNA-binding GntR family transcriptional regulator
VTLVVDRQAAEWRPSDDVPRLYVDQLRDELRKRIGDGSLRGKLPTEPEMAARFGVSRSTWRDAVQKLADDGLIETIPRRGTFVVPEGERKQGGR